MATWDEQEGDHTDRKPHSERFKTNLSFRMTKPKNKKKIGERASRGQFELKN